MTRTRAVPPTAGALTRATAVAAGLLTAAVVAVLRVVGVIEGAWVLGPLVVALLAVPTSRLLARRILLNGAIVVGVVPALWWWDLPLGDLGRAGLLLAALIGGLTAWLLWSGLPAARERARQLVPSWHTVDLLPLGAAAASLWFMQAWLRVSTGSAALAALVPGWDHSAHYGMVHALRLNGVTADAVAAPAGEHWQFASYPQGYHSLVATVMEAVSSTTVADPGTEVVTYLRAICLTLLLAAVMVAAGLCALPRLRRRPAVALPVVALAVAAFVIGPGAASFAHGFVNFVMAAALTACIPLVVVTMPRIALPVQLAAVGALLVAVAHSWALLLVMALPAALVLLLPLRRSRWRADRRSWLLTGLVLAATGVGLLMALRTLVVYDAGAVLVLPGGVLGPEMGALVAVVLGALGLCLWGATRASTRVTWAATGPVVGLLAAAGVALLQRRAGAEPSYYFWKLVIGVELLAVVVLGIAVARSVRAAQPGRSRAPALRTAVASVVVAAGLSQVFDPAANGSELFGVPSFELPHAELVLRAAAVRAPAGMRTVRLTADGERALDPLNAQQWHLALTGAWTSEANAQAASALIAEGGGRQDLLVAAGILLEDAGTWVIAPPEVAATLRTELPDDQAARVMSW